MKLFLASGNAHKAAELQGLATAGGLNVEIVSARAVGGMPEVVEDTGTFVGNARKKARALWERLPAGSWALVTAAVSLGYVATLKLGPADGYAGPWQTLVASVDMLSSYPGSPVARMREPWRLATILAIAGTLAAAVPALRRSAAGAPDRRSLVILVGYLACLGLVAAAIGYGRGTRDFTHLYGHYSTLALAIPLALGLVWAALPQTIVARGAQAILCLTALVVFTVHARQAVRNWGSGAESWALIATDMRGELPPEEVAARHAASLYFLDTPDVRAKIAACVGMLRRTTFPLYCARPASPEPPSP
jgi:hypothetical protein